jgi:hypothetical protein
VDLDSLRSSRYAHKTWDYFLLLLIRALWMRRVGDHCKCIAVYVDDLVIASKDPAGVVGALTEDCKFKLKGTGPIEQFHLGYDFFGDKEGVLCFPPRKHIDKLVALHEGVFGSKLDTATKIKSSLVKRDHPEMEDSAFLEEEGIQQHQLLVGQLQWAPTLGRFDIAVVIMMMSAFRSAPRVEHLD